jgi:hypothetical protein
MTDTAVSDLVTAIQALCITKHWYWRVKFCCDDACKPGLLTASHGFAISNKSKRLVGTVL